MKSPTELFKEAEKFCLANGFGKEIEWCENRPPFNAVTAQVFLAEYAWVVYNSGMKNSVIAAKWEDLRRAFLWFDYKEICAYSDAVREKALNIFGNKAKVDAVIKMAKKMGSTPTHFKYMKELIQKDPLTELIKFPFIGPTTKYHLARNLGFDFIKPDRHLVRLAKKYNMSPEELCNQIHKETGRRLGVIDVILWRFCEQRGQTRFE